MTTQPPLSLRNYCFGCKVELDINDFERLDIDARGAVWRRDDRDGRLLRLCGTDGSFGIA